MNLTQTPKKPYSEIRSDSTVSSIRLLAIVFV